MARIHEVAKELGIDSKEIIEYLASIGITGKKAASGIDDETILKVKTNFGENESLKPQKSPEATDKESSSNNKAAEKKENVQKTARPKKKKISAVYNPQNAQSGNSRGAQSSRSNYYSSDRPARRRGEDKQASLRPGFERVTSVPRPKRDKAANKTLQEEKMVKNPKEEVSVANEAAKQQTQKQQTVKKVDSIENAHPVIKKQGNIFDQLQKAKARDEKERQEKGRNFKKGSSAQEKKNSSDRRNQDNKGRSLHNIESGYSRVQENAPTKGGDKRRDSSRRGEGGHKGRRNFESERKQERYVNLEKHGGRKKQNKQPQPKPAEAEDTIKTMTLPDKISVKDLADKMKIQPAAIVKKLFLQGTMVTVNQELDFDAAEEIALEYNYICEHEVKIDVIAELLKEEEEDESLMVSRPPVVCVMGHVDHGKTSLLDAIRNTNVIGREAGGITQHIGASVVSINNQTITFLDTPGHEAFTAMRMRGANSTDIAILVVAADDGVMPQTIEAINHAKAAGIEIIVAVNKIDKPSANVEKVKQELSEYELIPEDWGGSTIFVPVSAHTGEGIDKLLEMVLLTAEICELKANPNRNARGLVIEARLDKGRGVVATMLVQKGTLKVGEPIAAGSAYGKVRAMTDDRGKRVKTAGPSTPVEIIGLNQAPNAGEIFVMTDSEKEARNFAETFVAQEKEKLLDETKSKMSLEDLYSKIQEGNLKELDIIVKADVQGSVEAVKQSLEKLSNEEIVVKVIHGGVGAINESDIILASASNAIVIGFNVRPDNTAKLTADQEGVDVRLYKVIYNAIEDVEEAMKGMLDPVYEEKVIGHAQVRQIFKASGVGNIAGSYVLDGFVERDCLIRINRGDDKIFEGKLASLKRFKDDVKEVKAGYECGLVFEEFNDFAEEDVIEAYKMVEVPR